LQDRQGFGFDEELNGSADAGLSSDQCGAFEGKNHLMDRGGVTRKKRWKSASAGGLPLSCV